jgi:hypothetical protein
VEEFHPAGHSVLHVGDYPELIRAFTNNQLLPKKEGIKETIDMVDWVTPKEAREAKRFLADVSSLLSDLGGPLTRELSALIREGKYVELVNYQFDYRTDTTVRDFVLARQVHALLQKQEWMDLGIDTKAVAMRKFDEMEVRCSATNRRLDSNQLSAGTWRALHEARKVTKRILGQVPSLSNLKFSFGPGATTNVKAAEANPRVKLTASLACSRESFPVVGDLLAQVPQWVLHHSRQRDAELDFYRSNPIEGPYCYPCDVDVAIHPGKLTFVPKDARSMRSIIVEPVLNGFCQQGIGRYLKDRLLRCVGVDLTDQTRNQELARKGSVDGSYATIDLSSASDTISLSVVEKLLPQEWFDFLLSWTTGEIGTLDGPRRLEKFSSMGNVFTFELESLIFYSLAKACTVLCDSQSDVSVFGDDIIIGAECSQYLIETLVDLGFLVNNEKSFLSGPFRESCGADWLNGNSIRPFYWKRPLNELTLYTFHNFLVRNGEHELANLVHSWTEPSLRLYGPDGYGDGHLIGSFSLRLGRKYKRRGWEGGFFESYSLRPRRLKKRYAGDWVYPSYSVYTRSGERDPTDPDIVRGSNGYAKISIYTLARSVWNR